MTTANLSPADRYRALADRFSAIVAAVPADAWSAPSPCEGWSAEEVLAHVVATQRDLLVRRGEALDVDTASPTAAWPVVRAKVQSLLDDPAFASVSYDGFFGPTNFAATVDTFYAFDLVVHAWDIAHAAGLTDLASIPADEMERIRRDMAPMAATMRSPTALGPEIEVPDSADEQTKFLAWLGRRP